MGLSLHRRSGQQVRLVYKGKVIGKVTLSKVKPGSANLYFDMINDVEIYRDELPADAKTTKNRVKSTGV